VCDIKRAS
ncbi:Diaminopimelate epimerase, partial [Haemophilus influenzae]